MNDSDSLSLAPELATDAAVPRLVPEGAAEATAPPRTESRRSFGPLSRRLADQGLFLFRHRGLFVVFLLPAARPRDPGAPVRGAAGGPRPRLVRRMPHGVPARHGGAGDRGRIGPARRVDP